MIKHIALLMTERDSLLEKMESEKTQSGSIPQQQWDAFLTLQNKIDELVAEEVKLRKHINNHLLETFING